MPSMLLSLERMQEQHCGATAAIDDFVLKVPPRSPAAGHASCMQSCHFIVRASAGASYACQACNIIAKSQSLLASLIAAADVFAGEGTVCKLGCQAPVNGRCGPL